MAANWQLTQQALQSAESPLVAKPELTEKLLSKPPFRFLHDVISAVQTSTGFASGLYNGQEMDARAIQDKEGKVAYLNKIMVLVGMVLNQPVPANPLKVVAGLEPENTNTFLQMLGAAAKLGPAADAVQAVLAQYPPAIGSNEMPPAAAAAAGPSASAMPEPPPSQPTPPAPQQQQQRAEPPPPPQQAPRRTADLDEQPSSRGASRQPAAAPPPAAAAPPPPAALGRPQSAKKAPPKAATPEGAAAPRPGARAAAGGILGDKPGGPGGAAKPITIIEEGRGAKAGSKAAPGDLDDDDDVPVVVAALAGSGGMAGRGGLAGAGGQGVLVQDIMAAQQQVKAAGGDDTGEGGGDGAEGTGIILKRTAKAAAGGAGAGTKDVAALRDTVQELCQCALPLSRNVEHLQEDLDSLAKEYKFWLTERRVYQSRLTEEQQAALDLSSLERRLAEKEGACREARQRLAALKAQVLREDEAIMKLLNMVLSAG